MRLLYPLQGWGWAYRVLAKTLASPFFILATFASLSAAGNKSTLLSTST